MADSNKPVDPRSSSQDQPPPAPEQPAEEWGQREATGRQIASGGKASERPPGETPKAPD